MDFIDNNLKLSDFFEKDIVKYKNILKSDKNNVLILYKIAYCYRKQHNYNLAVKYLTKIKHLTPFDSTIYFEIGCTEYENGNCCKAKKNLIQAIKLKPQYYDAYYFLGKTHELCDENEMAEMIYLKIIECCPKYILAYNRLANLYMQLENYKKAIKYFKGLTAINPEDETAYLGLAKAFEELGQNFEAKKYYKKYLEIKPFSKYRDYILLKLKQFRQGKIINRVARANLYLVK